VAVADGDAENDEDGKDWPRVRRRGQLRSSIHPSGCTTYLGGVINPTLLCFR
jgi:hypothetical protein